eukprot:GHVR01105348.1.p1 GENE.GHVR01105348.1~~GHVR01105348.1.p1  ORF type:complete len:289 (+),score=41.87 GHVR01105348.1:107-973(+)
MFNPKGPPFGMFLNGPSRSGKSSLIEALGIMLGGNEAMRTINLDDMMDNDRGKQALARVVEVPFVAMHDLKAVDQVVGKTTSRVIPETGTAPKSKSVMSATESKVKWAFVNLGKGLYLSTAHVMEADPTKWSAALKIIDVIPTSLESLIVYYMPDVKSKAYGPLCNLRLFDKDIPTYLKRYKGQGKMEQVSIPNIRYKDGTGTSPIVEYDSVTTAGDSGKHLRQGDFVVGIHVALNQTQGNGVGIAMNQAILDRLEVAYNARVAADDTLVKKTAVEAISASQAGGQRV